MLYSIPIFLFLTLCYISTAQTNSHKKILEYKSDQHKKRLEDIENIEKYPMVYIDKTVYNSKNKKVYLYSSYDLIYGEELGLGFNIGLLNIKKKKK